eukprot:scaffold123907_cov28-Prasinocladus_malaysianus.AAC.1
MHVLFRPDPRPGYCTHVIYADSTARDIVGLTFCIDSERINRAHVVVASCSSAALLAPIMQRSGLSFCYVIVDEAAQ